MKTSSQTLINHPAERINLGRWISTLSDRDYQACSRAHRAAGTFREGGTLGMVNVESVGGNLLVQHYLATKLAADHVVMHSKNSRVYVSHLLPATIEVTLDPRSETQGRTKHPVQLFGRDSHVAPSERPIHCSAAAALPAAAHARGDARLRRRHFPESQRGPSG